MSDKDKLLLEVNKAICNNIKALEQPCEDAVSRQAVLDNAYAYGNGLEPEGYCVNVEDIQSLPPVTPTQRWIPCRERLPEERKAVLVYCPERKNIYCACYENEQWWIFGAYFEKIEFEVVAWQPLPPSYKGE